MVRSNQQKRVTKSVNRVAVRINGRDHDPELLQWYREFLEESKGNIFNMHTSYTFDKFKRVTRVADAGYIDRIEADNDHYRFNYRCKTGILHQEEEFLLLL